MELKVGDTVRVKDAVGDSTLRNGAVGEIASIDKTLPVAWPFRVKFPDDVTCLYTENELVKMPRTWEVKEKPKQYIVFDENDYLIFGNGVLEEEIVEGKDKLIETLEELSEDFPEAIGKYKVFEIIPVPFFIETAAVKVTLDC